MILKLNNEDLLKLSPIANKITELSEKLGIKIVTGVKKDDEFINRLELPAPQLKHSKEIIYDDTAIIELSNDDLKELIEMIILSSNMDSTNIRQIADSIDDIIKESIDLGPITHNPYIELNDINTPDIIEFNSIEEYDSYMKDSVFKNGNTVKRIYDNNINAVIRLTRTKIFAITHFNSDRYIVAELTDKSVRYWELIDTDIFNKTWYEEIMNLSESQLNDLASVSRNRYLPWIERMT